MALKIAWTNFWPTFSLDNGLLNYLLNLAYGDWEVTTDLVEADLVLTSVFPHTVARFPEKTIALIWENVRPDYRGYRFSLSSDFDDYDGRNVRCPVWYSQVEWSKDIVIPPPSGGGAHNREALVPLKTLLNPRTGPYVRRPKFCAIVASNPEVFRIRAVEALSEIEPVDVYGGAFGKIDPRSKFEILKEYVFSLCFENSMFPGYYTEKPLQAWAAGTIPLYFSDCDMRRDFNWWAVVNRSDYDSMRNFVEDVRKIYADDNRLEKLWTQQLLIGAPSLDPVVKFLREALQCIKG